MTAASEYSCLALLSIAESGSEWCKRQEITERFDVPTPFLEQILRKLVAARLIVSRRGSDGGFKLARPASVITIAEVMRAVDGALAPVRSVSENFYQPSPVEASPGFHTLFRRVRDAVADILENTTLEDVVEQEKRIRTRSRKSAAAARRNPARSRSTREQA
ncbi:MAG TPA: Rrf2 family transcriptional regulator [Thermoanaerobaculia bacterium]|nr:Rrf2 family transcriptional regulator [Thermoanaerobaculia bacterium]